MNNLKRNVASEDNIEFGLEFCVQVTHETIRFDFFFCFCSSDGQYHTYLLSMIVVQ